MRWRNCIFDLYGTLVDIHTDEDAPVLWVELAEHYRRRGADYHPEELHRAYLRLVGEMERGMAPLRRDAHEAHPEIQLEYVFQALYREKGVEVDLEEAVAAGRLFRRISTEYIRLYDGAAELLGVLRANGQNVYLLSNAQSIFTMDELDRLGIADLFDGIYLSSDYGCKKPDRRFYEVLLRERGIDPASAVMVGNDGVCDIRGARAVGLSTVYLRSNLSPREPTPEADYALGEMDLRRVREILMA